ncbi:uncharacterized protein TNCV_583551 [Trichonephila clavipes]|nr:uncharacterized protein TNCV_583551 [Trichonephila clavipes]
MPAMVGYLNHWATAARYIQCSVGLATGVDVQRCHVFHAHMLLLQIFKRRGPHLSQMESHKQNSLDVRTKSNRATRGLLATDHVILNHGQVTWTTPELAPPLLTTTPHQREDVSALDRFSVHRCPTRRVFSGTGLELVTKPATVRYLYHSATVFC